MSLEQSLHALASKLSELKPLIETEEATKTAFIIPFISNVLGYDVTDPREVIPEYTADIGRKKGEKVDFAIKSGNDFRFLIECKKIGEPLDLSHATQLVRYFNVTDTEFAILTNGEVYQFYAQLDAVNRMDEKPFMTLDLSAIDSRIFPHLEMCTKANFDSDSIAAKAEELKYVSQLRKEIAAEFKSPSVDFVRMLTSKVTDRRMTTATVELFTRLTGVAASQFLSDEVNRRLRSAQAIDSSVDDSSQLEAVAEEQVVASPEVEETGIVTTNEELQALSIIKAICCSEVKASEVTLRDAKSYCAILYDDNNRKTIVRLYFDRKVPRIVIFDRDKNEIPHDLSEIEDIYNFSDEIRDRIKFLRDN